MTDRNQPPYENYPVYGRARHSEQHYDHDYGHGYHQEPPRRSSGFLSVLLYVALGLVALIVGGVTFLMVAPPTDAIRRQIIAEVKANTGRDLTISGPTSFTFYPGLGLSMQQVALSAPPTMGGRPLVAMGALDVSVALLPLLSGAVAVDKLVLRQPVFELRIDKAGRKSWEFAAADQNAAAVRLAAAGTVELAQLVTPAAAQAKGLPPGMKQFSLGEVRIENGTIRYADEAAGTRQEVRAIDASFGLKSISSPFEVTGSFDWSGEKLAFASVLTTPQSLLENRPVKLGFNLQSRPVNARYDGALTLADTPALDGQVNVNSASLRALAAWLGTQLPPAQGFGPLGIEGRLKTSAKAVTFSDAKFSLDGATATGTVAVDSAAARPHLNATLRISELDLNKYISNGAAAAPAPAPAARPRQDAPSGRDAIEDILRREQQPATRVKGYTARAGWSDQPIDTASLGLLDADAKITVGRLLYQNLKVGQSALTFQIKNKVMTTTFDDVALYEGKGKGFVKLDGAQGNPVLGANFTLDGISAEPLLKDAAEIDWLAGTGKLTLAVSGQGKSERQIIETLNGKSTFAFTDGAIIGINIPQFIRGLSQGKLESLDLVPSERTDFSEMSASFNVTNGIAESTDLKMLSPLLRIGGAGKVMLPEREIDYTVRPKLVANLQGQGGEQGLGGLEIPVRISGSWDAPEIAPDIGGVLKDPGKVTDAIKDLGKQLKGKNAGEVVDDLFKGKDGQPSKAQQFLDKLFK